MPRNPTWKNLPMIGIMAASPSMRLVGSLREVKPLENSTTSYSPPCLLSWLRAQTTRGPSTWSVLLLFHGAASWQAGLHGCLGGGVNHGCEPCVSPPAPLVAFPFAFLFIFLAVFSAFCCACASALALAAALALASALALATVTVRATKTSAKPSTLSSSSLPDDV